jgi:dTDP-glucose 4,6-dehydratase
MSPSSKTNVDNKRFWQGNEVLVTGAGGFIASHLVERLVQLGAKVRAFVRYNSRNDLGLLALSPPEILSEVDVIAGDLNDPSAVLAASNDVKYIFHLGALIAIPYSYIHPREVIETNVIGTLNVLLAARYSGAEKIIHTSTSEVYGTALQPAIDENHPLQGQSPYAASKIGADKIAESFYRSFDLPVVTLRPFNTYGPRQSARAIVPTIISQALTKDIILLGNLNALRDLTYVSDTVEGFIKVAEVGDVAGETFNLGAGEEISIGNLAKKVISLVDRTVNIVVDKQRIRPEKSEVQRLLADNSLAREKLGWQPKVGLSQGLEKTIRWVENHINLYDAGTYQI